ADYPTIQEGIDAAQDGDLVLVDSGVYIEIIDFKGKAIAVQSSSGPANTVIDGGDMGSVVTFKSFEENDSILDGFTIRNGNSLDGGGGIFCQASSPTIVNNRIKLNDGFYYGGGIYIAGGSPLIQNNNIFYNIAGTGSGIYGEGSAASIIENQIVDNGMGG
ncbi:MAG: right-handed parallel beta-helix repeat-containing protein, partial [Planctomycetota bacterium]